MKAMLFKEYGGAEKLFLSDVDTPSPKEHEVLIKVKATSLNSVDLRTLTASPALIRVFFGLFRPKIQIMGRDFSGEIVALGKNVENFRVGDEVYGETQIITNGACAEFVCAPEKQIIKKPQSLSFQEAAALPLAAITALQALRDIIQVKAGDKLLLLGASGGVGSFAIQIAKYLGAEVCGVCSTKNVEMLRSLGADSVIDYRTDSLSNITERFDAILCINGGYPFSFYKKHLNPGGMAVLVGGENSQFFTWMCFSTLHSKLSGKKFKLFDMKMNSKDLEFLNKMKEDNALKIMIDKVYPLESLPGAILYMQHTHCQGKLVISLEPPPKAGQLDMLKN